jgi:hypothetical protein
MPALPAKAEPPPSERERKLEEALRALLDANASTMDAARAQAREVLGIV